MSIANRDNAENNDNLENELEDYLMAAPDWDDFLVALRDEGNSQWSRGLALHSTAMAWSSDYNTGRAIPEKNKAMRRHVSIADDTV